MKPRDGRTGKQIAAGFTLVEILITISIISILAMVLIPNLLAPRGLAHDTGTITCLKELGARQEAFATNEPFEYDQTLVGDSITACQRVAITVVTLSSDDYHYRGVHDLGQYQYEVTVGTPVRRVR